MDGKLAIKPQYLVSVEPEPKKRKIDDEDKQNTVNSEDTGETKTKNSTETEDITSKTNDQDDTANKSDKNEGKKSSKEWKKKGQNKSRPKPVKFIKYGNLCKAFFDGPDGIKKCKFDNCKFIHDIEKYLNDKPKDIAETCYIYTTKGYCSRGVTCRMANAHLDDKFNNLKTSDYNEENVQKTTLNQINFDLQMILRKRTYNFDLSKKIIASVDKAKKESRKGTTQVNHDDVDDGGNGDAETTVVDNDDDDKTKRIGCAILTEKSDKKKIDFHEKLLLSPLTTVGNLPFRRICKEYGADITCGEMACAVPIINGISQEWALAKRHISEDIFGVQICGNNPQLLTFAAQVLQENAEIDFIDLNLGCPIELIYGQGAGSALIRRQNILEIMVRSCSTLLDNAGDIPFTVKTRTGVYADKSVAHELVPKLERWGASAVTIHGRSREQRYTKSANWEYIEKCAAQAKKMPVFGNGDILSYEDYKKARETAPSVSGVMIGRGALIKPWLFQEIKEQTHLDPSSSERFEMLRKYVNYGLEHWGSDTQGVENTRRFLLEWQSFLCRYVPYGLLERPPQQINLRPDAYIGRDDLETLMASAKCSDWIKLSEMFLGPVPDGYNFLPKHKANAF